MFQFHFPKFFIRVNLCNPWFKIFPHNFSESIHRK